MESIELLPRDLCRELVLLQRICGVPGYRPHYTSTLLACAPPWALPAILDAREAVREHAEEKFDLCLDLHFETTALACWFPGAEVGAHADDCQEYLRHRDVSAAVWLNADFEGGEFFFQDEPPVQMGAGRGAVYLASTMHGVKPVTKGERFSFLVWMTKSEGHAEDRKAIASFQPVHMGAATERLFGHGPQAEWPEHSHVDREVVAGFTGRSIAELEESYCQGVDIFQLWFPLERWRIALSLAAFAEYRNDASLSPQQLAQELVSFIHVREAAFNDHIEVWAHQGFLAMRASRSSSGNLPLCALLTTGVPGLSLASDVLSADEQRSLTQVLSEMVGSCDQAMRFGDLPAWALQLASKVGIPAASQMIVNEYHPGKGIVRHIDLLRFGEQVCGVSFGADALMIFRQLTARTELCRGCECQFQEQQFTGRCVHVPLRPGCAYRLQGEARYRWTHEIPGESVTGRRLSVTLRTLLADGE